MKFLKDINWKNILTIVVVGVVIVPIVYPMVKPLLNKLPVVGKYFA